MSGRIKYELHKRTWDPGKIFQAESKRYKQAVAKRCSVKKMFLEISQNWQENTSARASFLIMLQASGLQLY